MYDENDYPITDRLHSLFGIEYRFIELGIPGRINSLSRTIYLNEKAKAQTQFAEASSVLVGALREEVKKKLRHCSRVLPNFQSLANFFNSL